MICTIGSKSAVPKKSLPIFAGKNTHKCQRNFTGLIFCLFIPNLLFSDERAFVRKTLMQPHQGIVWFVFEARLVELCYFIAPSASQTRERPLCDIIKVFRTGGEEENGGLSGSLRLDGTAER